MRLILTLLLTLAAVPAWAQWVKVDDAENAIHHIDSGTIGKDGQMRKVWVTQYLKEKGAGGEMARRVFIEYDCAGARFRILSVAKYSGAVPDGKYRLSQQPASQAGPEIPGSIPAVTAQRIICTP
jgi:hypothetical protein